MRPVIAVAWLLPLLALACDRSQKTPAPAASTEAASSAAPGSAAPADPRAAPPPARPPNPVERFVLTWSSALDRHDLELLGKLYAPRVRFYGARKTVAEVVGARRIAFKKEPDYRQRLGKVQIDETPSGYVVLFEKQSGPSFANAVEARLVLQANGDELTIVEETDSATDERLKKRAPRSCFDAAFAVLSGQSALEADIRRMARSHPNANPSSILYSEEPGKLAAAHGYFHPDKFEPRWWIDVANGELNIRNALTGEELAISGDRRTSVREACSSPADAGADAR